MDLNTIKENLTFPIKAPQYRVGVDGFMSFANNTLTHDGRLRCPCVKCVNNKLLNPDDVNYHLLQYGIMRNYSTWIFHGESVDQVPTSTSTEPTVEKETLTHMDMRQLNQIKNVATEQGDQELDLDDDPVSKVLGKDKYGRVRGLGLGVKPSDVGDPSYPRFCNGLNMSTDNEAAVIHYFRRLEGVVQRLRTRVKRQGIIIIKVKRKLRDHDISLSDESESDADIFSSKSDSEAEAEHDNQ
ncbi:30S ribosomal protein S3, partial [Bienertia sinuspersici]